jgi:localization factor PodJL
VKDSQVNLGILFTKGMGVTEDLEQAYQWFSIAAKDGDTDAAKKRDTVAQAMRPEQLERARGAAELWKPQELVEEANFASVADEWKVGNAETLSLSKEEMVRKAQSLLASAGFDAGPADGVFGDRTRRAIMSFQSKAGLPVDGEVSPALLDALSKQSI